MFINEECRNLIVVNDGGELTEKGRRFTVAHSVTNVEGESISSVTCRIFIVKQLGKHDFSCDFFTTE